MQVLFDDALGHACFLANASVNGWFFHWRKLFKVNGFQMAFLRTCFSVSPFLLYIVPCFSIPCLLCLSILHAVCGRYNLLWVCTKPTWISRFGWGCWILIKGLVKTVSMYTVEAVMMWNFPLRICFLWRNCLSKNRQTNPCKKMMLKNVNVVIYQFSFFFSRPCRDSQ